MLIRHNFFVVWECMRLLAVAAMKNVVLFVCSEFLFPHFSITIATSRANTPAHVGNIWAITYACIMATVVLGSGTLLESDVRQGLERGIKSANNCYRNQLTGRSKPCRH